MTRRPVAGTCLALTQAETQRQGNEILDEFNVSNCNRGLPCLRGPMAPCDILPRRTPNA